MNHAEYVAGLRAAADFYEKHEEVKLPHHSDITNFSVTTKEDAASVIRALGSCEKTYTDDSFVIAKEIAPGFLLRFYWSRNEVCERVKVSEKVIPAHTLPAREETFVPEKVEEVFEWRCPGSLLAHEEAEIGGAA